MVSFLCAIGLLTVPAAAPAGLIAFVSGTNQQDQCVCVADIATGAVSRVGPGQGDGPPVWSPDGSWLAFETCQPEGIGICLARPDGAESHMLAHGRKWNHYPRWSPDGAFLTYETDDGDSLTPHTVVYDVQAGTETAWGGDDALLTRPVWMPSLKLLYGLRPGQKVLWGNEQTGVTGLEWLQGEQALLAIGLKRGTGTLSTDVCIVTQQKSAALPEWVLPSPGNYVEWAAEPSPSGDSIAFESNDGGNREIFVLTKQGPADISNHRAADWNPVWSPDGAWIAFESFRDGTRGIYRAYVETAMISPVAVSPNDNNWWPSWSPDGKSIVFVSDRTGDPEIFTTDMAGQRVNQITNHPGPDYAPAWQPVAKPRRARP